MEEKIRSKEFQNWMKCVSAQNETRKALCETVEVRWKGFISRLTEEEKDQIEKFLECVKSANINYLKKDLKQCCNHVSCALLLQKLLYLLNSTFVPGKDYSYIVPSSDPCYGAFWDIAKLYLHVEDDIATNCGLKGLALCHLLEMMNHCQLFAFEGSSEAFKSINEDRDELFHTSDYSITDEKRQNILAHLSNVLSHFSDDEPNTCTDVQADLQQNETKDWMTEYTFQYKQIARKMLELKTAALESDIIIQKKKLLEAVLETTETFLKEVIESISTEESANEHDALAEIESLREKIRLQEEDKSVLVCKNEELLKTVSEQEQKISRLNRDRDLQVSELEKEICLANTTGFLFSSQYDRGNIVFKPQPSSSYEISVTNFGNFQDLFVQIDGIVVLFDPLEPKLLKNFFPYEVDAKTKDRDILYSFPLDALILSTCLNGFNATTVQKIVGKSPRVKWIIPRGIKDKLVQMGIIESSIEEFSFWEEKVISFVNKTITFGCTPTYMNGTLPHSTKCNTCGWIIKGSKRTFYSSGITNYKGSLFEKVAERYSPIHLAVLPNRTLSCLTDYIVTPNETVKMYRDIKAEQSLGIVSGIWHWHRYRVELKKKLDEEMKKLKVDTSKLYLMEPGKTYRSDETNWDSD